MRWWSRVRVDLARPSAPFRPDQLGFLVVSAVVIVGVSQVTDPGTAAELAALSPAVAAYVLRGVTRRIPEEALAAAVIVPIALVVGHSGHLEGTFFLIVNVVLFNTADLRSNIRAGAILLASAVTPWIVAERLAPDSEIGWTAWTCACVFTFVLGKGLGRQRELIDQLEQARHALAEQAVADERRRIARELHDLAGHTLAAVMLHVTGARHVLRRDVDEAERALVDAETVGRASLDQIRATVAALRTDERGTDPALTGSADLVALVEEYRRAGLTIDTDIAPAALDVHGPIGTALHRIAREALANVAHHAPTNSVALSLQCESSRLRLVVADHGRSPARPASGNGHFGIIGMRERAHALGGELDAGPTSDGWRVEARLPWVPSATHVEVPS